jgi:hypothetical protein
MKKILMTAAALLLAGCTTALAETCTVADPTGTPLNVRSRPSVGASAIISGQSFSVISGAGFGPLTVANGSMGAGGLTSPFSPSLTYQESAKFHTIWRRFRA